MKKKIKNCIMKLLCIAMLTTVSVATFVPAYSVPAVEDGSSGGTDVVQQGINALDTATGKLTAVAMSVFPFALIAVFILLMMTHNEKKVAGLLYVAGIIVIATFAIILVNNGTALELIKQLASYLGE